MRVLVTGGAGFLGSHLCEALVARGDSVLCVDSFDPHYPMRDKLCNLSSLDGNPNFAFLKGDVREPSRLLSWLRGEKFDAIAHLAARDSERESLLAPRMYFDLNTTGTLGALELARRLGVGRFVMTSAASVYGGLGALPWAEDAPTTEVLSVHGASKLAAEALCQCYAATYGIGVCILRVFSAYGPRQRPDTALRRFAEQLLAGQPATVYGDGKSTRDFVFCDDVVRALVLALDKEFRCEIINIGSGRQSTVLELLELVASELGVKPEVVHRPPYPGEPEHALADVQKARELLGFEAQVELREGVRRFARWLADVRRAAQGES